VGRALLIIALGFSTLFGTMTLNLSRHSLDSVQNYSDHYNNVAARNSASSGIYMSLSKLSKDLNWRKGFGTRAFSGGTLEVDVQDLNDDPNLSSMELKIVSTANYDNVNKSIETLVGVPPDLGDLAVFCTDTIDNVTVKDESGNPDTTLAILNAPDMLPFDKDGLAALASSQGHVIAGNFSAPDGYPINDFYFNAATNTPNVTHVQGDFTIGGGTSAYGIYIVEGNATLDGNARLEGVLYLPNPGSIVIHGGGNPNDCSITGGVFANGSLNGTGNHISVQYEQDYMEAFAVYQTATNLFIISWIESPDG